MFYTVVKFFVKIYMHVMYKIEVSGLENVPTNEKAILCPNHLSMFDPIVIVTEIKYKINFLGKKELFQNKVLAYIMKEFNVIPVDREKADFDSYKKVLKTLHNGEIIAIFAQGTRVKNMETTDAKNGVAMFALKTKTPVIPVSINASYKIFSKVQLKFGKPMEFSEYYGQKITHEILDEVTNKIMTQIKNSLTSQ